MSTIRDNSYESWMMKLESMPHDLSASSITWLTHAERRARNISEEVHKAAMATQQWGNIDHFNGKLVSVHWPDARGPDGCTCFLGLVTSFCSRTGEHTVLYGLGTGDEEEVSTECLYDLDFKHVRVVGVPTQQQLAAAHAILHPPVSEC